MNGRLQWHLKEWNILEKGTLVYLLNHMYRQE